MISILWAVVTAGATPAVAAVPAGPAAHGYFEVGRTLLAGGDGTRGLPLLAAATLAGRDAQAAQIYLLGLLNQSCFEWNVATLEAARPVLPDDPALLECLGRQYEGKGRYAAAEAVYLHWAGAHPELREPYARLGELYVTAGRRTQALAAFARYRELNPGSTYAARRMAAVAAEWAQALVPVSEAMDDTGRTEMARLRRGAEGGDPVAQYVLGLLLERGRTPDPTLAALWYGRAARQGYPEAAFRLARLLRRGQVEEGSPDAAAGWLAQAAAQGLATAQFEMAVACLGGEAGTPDLAEGVAWAAHAAQQGLPHAAFLLATLHAYGIGMSVDRDRAVEWYLMASMGFSKAGRTGPARLARDAAQRLAPEVGGGAAPGDVRRPTLAERGMP